MTTSRDAARPPRSRASARSQVRGSALLLVGRVLAMGLGLIIQLMLVRLLTKEDYGAFAWALSVVTLVQAVIPLGLDRIDSRFLAVSDEQGDDRTLVGVLVAESGIVVVLGLVSFLLVLLWHRHLAPGIAPSDTAANLLVLLVLLAPLGALDAMVLNTFATFARPRSVFLRRYLLERYGEKALYQEGLTVTVPATRALSKAATLAVQSGLREVDKRQGFRGPVAQLAERKVGLVIVPNGSPYERNKDDVRLALVQERARGFGAALAYVNMVGAQDDLVFDGDSIVVDAAGEVLMRTKQFEDQLAIHDLTLPLQTSNPDVIISDENIKVEGTMHGGIAQRKDDLAEIWEALKSGLRDYVRKNGFKSVVLGLSGGIDSALVASIAVDALGAENVHAVALPSKYSSEHSISDAEDLARRTGLNFRIVPIDPMVNEFVSNLSLTGLAEENVQARVRGTTLMGISNQEGHLVLATGNKSELAVGYSTLYGDAVGGFAPIKDIYKTQVWELARWRNDLAIYFDQTPPIPVNSIEKEPSAELRPDQKDTDSLPDYLLLDQLLTRYVDEDEGAASLIAGGFSHDLVNRVISLVDKAEYKRRQYPPGTKISARAFGKDRRLPVTSRWKER